MGAAVVTTGLGYRIALAKPAPLFGSGFHHPTATAVDARLVTGAALFGIGWGLVGYCPGPAIAALSAGSVSTFIFVAAMLAGMATERGAAVANFTRSNTAVAGSTGGTR